MKTLKQTEQVIAPADQPVTPSIVIIVDDPAVAHSLISSTRCIPANRQSPQAFKTVPNESRLQGLIRNERELLHAAFDEFISATKHLIGTMVNWIIWRIVVPLSVMSVLWMAFAASAELPV